MVNGTGPLSAEFCTPRFQWGAKKGTTDLGGGWPDAYRGRF